MYGNVIQLKKDNRGAIEETIFDEHDERIIPKSELMSVDGNKINIEKIELSELFKKISEAQKANADIPRNWVGHFCRSGKALNLDYLKTQFSGYGIELEDDIFGGVINYKQGDGSQLTHQSSLSSRRFPSNFKQIVNKLYGLNRGGENEKDLYEIKNKIDKMQPLGFIDVAKVLLNLQKFK